MAMLPNLKNFAFFLIGYFFLFFPLCALSILQTQSMRVNGFGNLGYFSLGIIYLTYGLTNVYAQSIIKLSSIKKILLFSGIA